MNCSILELFKPHISKTPSFQKEGKEKQKAQNKEEKSKILAKPPISRKRKRKEKNEEEKIKIFPMDVIRPPESSSRKYLPSVINSLTHLDGLQNSWKPPFPPR